jgi:hypothetical protein
VLALLLLLLLLLQPALVPALLLHQAEHCFCSCW